MNAERIAAGLALSFAPGERPDMAALQAALEAGSSRAQICWTDAESGAAQILVDGLAFDCDGLASGLVADVPLNEPQGEPIRLYPGVHLSGGMGLAPVVRPLLALAAQLVDAMPVRSVYWGPSQVVMEPDVFVHATMGWLAGGSFPTCGLVALLGAEDGSIGTRGLAHLIGQELMFQPPSGADATRRAQLAGQIVDRLITMGSLTTMTRIALPGLTLCAEPAPHARLILVWPMLEAEPI